jgi:hypothetical protein
MATYDSDKATKGKRGEDALNEWFKREGLPYLYVGQSPDTFSTLFPNAAKRPDFLLLLQSLGLIAVDAKNYTLFKGVFTLNLEQELRKMLTFERLFRIPVWFAYMNSEDESKWYWISGLKAVEVGEVRTKESTGETFLAIPLEHFAEVNTSADLGKLYAMKINSLEKIKAL